MRETAICAPGPNAPHIAVDGSSWGGQERGVAVAGRRLWSALLARTAARVTVLAPAEFGARMPAAFHVALPALKGAARLRWQQLVLPGVVRARQIEILHCPCYTAPLSASCKLVVTVHDLIAFTHPRLAGWRNALHLRLMAGHSVRRADAVCVPTDVVRRSVIERFALPPGKVFVVPWGVDAELVPLGKDEAARVVRNRFGVDEPFALFCGCIEAKKNLPAAIRACEDAGLLLLAVGPVVAGSAAVLSRAGPAENTRWRYLGYVPAAELSALYSAAVALVYPSHVEGFGLPPVEAMRCGCPVVASDSPAVREVCAGAALHVAPSDMAALASAIRAIATDRGLRESLEARGKARAAAFTWAVATERFGEALAFAGR